MSKYDVVVDDVVVCTINEALVKSKKISSHRLEAIKKLHKERYKIIEHMKSLKVTLNLDEIKECAKIITEIDFSLQELWKFPKDETHHAWFDVPHCLCPKMDNRERRGTKYQVINQECFIHGR